MAVHGLLPAPPRQEPAVNIPQDVACYRVMDEKGFYVDDRLIPYGKPIMWEEEPSLNMEPLNELAIDAYKKFLAKLDKFGQEKALADKKHYTPLLSRFENKVKAEEEIVDNRRAKVLGVQKEVAVMGAKRAAPKAKELSADNIETATPVDRLRLK